jgi:hypothetical protein
MSNPEHPPDIAQSSINAMVAQFNALAGMDSSSFRSAVSTANEQSAKTLASAAGIDGAVPVILTGSRPLSTKVFPGLREAMIGAAIYRLAEQIPADSRHKQALLDMATALHESGAEKILNNRKPGRPGSKRKKGSA